MGGFLDDALRGSEKQAEDHIRKGNIKQKTKCERIVDYESSSGEGKARVVTCNDGEKFFVTVILKGPFDEKKVVDIESGSAESALVGAEEEFSKEVQDGSISLASK
jgi:hypothetical protein